MPATPRPRMLVLGLDGLPFTLARDLARSVPLPGLARLTNHPHCRPIRAELPELSPVNWTSFFTAAPPGVHGVFGFTELDPCTYALRTTDFRDVAGPTIFDRLGSRGLFSRVVNLPGTAPVRPIKGALVAGFNAPDLNSAVYPPYLKAMLVQAGYRLEADTLRGAKDHDLLLRELDAALHGRRAALDLLWPDLDWDLFVFVLTETDRLFHFLFPALLHQNHPLHRECIGLLKRLDRLVADVLDRFDALPGPKRCIALADHGFTELITEVDLNAWLNGRGYLRLAGTPRSELDASCIAPDTAAFALDPGRIYLHTKTRYAGGTLGPDAADRLARTIREELLGLAFRGEPVFERILLREELYPATPHAHAPDLVCLSRPGYDCKAKFDRKDVFGVFGRSGCHTAHDLFFFDTAADAVHAPSDAGKAVLDFFTQGLVVSG